jgi:hypothetical protein
MDARMIRVLCFFGLCTSSVLVSSKKTSSKRWGTRQGNHAKLRDEKPATKKVWMGDIQMRNTRITKWKEGKHKPVPLSECSEHFFVSDSSLCYAKSSLTALVPTLFILGCQKCGTSSLHDQLVKVFPRVLDNGLKETHFFTKDGKVEFTHMGCEFLLAQGRWKGNTACSGSGRNSVAIDSTPNYLPSMVAPDNIHTMYGEFGSALRFVVILRRPSERILSYFNHFHPAKNFEKWASTGLYALKKGIVTCDKGAKSVYRLTGKRFDAVRVFCASMYAAHLKRWVERFSGDQILLMPFSGYTSDPRPALSAIASFLDLDTHHIRKRIAAQKQASHTNAAQSHGRSTKATMPDELEVAIDEYFLPFDADLLAFVQEQGLAVAEYDPPVLY